MKIKKLEVVGFKSFVDRTVLHFDHDITVVVGPNGCGKSNVVDAIRWVMGEQSAKNLRGRGMEDVIFNGAETRGPSGFAEVTLLFDNRDGLAPAEYNDFAEIAVTRRLSRDGSSEYLINKAQVRLLDVTNLFLGTGVGRKSTYSIVEQGRIGLIVSAKPYDRRYLIEEAAGITKFKARKRAAERKMEYTQQNLLRVSDVIQEIQKTLASLKRQAQKAERYKRYRNEIRDLELWIASFRWLELHANHRVVRGQLEAVETRLEQMRHDLHARETELEAERLALQGIESELEQGQGKAFEADNRVRLLESQIEHHDKQRQTLDQREQSAQTELESLGAQRAELSAERSEIEARLEGHKSEQQAEAEVLERETAELERRRTAAEEAERTLLSARARSAEAETGIARAEAALAGFDQRRRDQRARLERIAEERSKLETQATELEQQAEALRARLEGLRSGKEAIGKAHGDLAEELKALREEIVGSDERVESLRSELATKRSRLHSLLEIQQRFEGVGAGVRAVMTGFAGGDKSSVERKVRGLVADRVGCPPELTQALAAALGEKLQYVVVDDLDTGVDAVRYLSEGKRGRATLIPAQPRGEREGQGLEQALANDGVVGRLGDLVRVEAEDRSLAEHLLGDVVVVEDFAVARSLHDQGLQGSALLVSRDGQVLWPDGTLSGGDGEDVGAHLLEVKREVRQLKDEVAELVSHMDVANAHHGSLRNAIAQRQAAMDATRANAHEQELGLVKTERDLASAVEARRTSGQRLDALERETTDLDQQLQAGSDEEKRAEQLRGEALEQKAQAAQEVGAADEIHRGRREAVDAQGAVVTEVRVRTAQAKQRVEGDRAVAERLARSLIELDTREKRLQSDLQDFSGQREQLSSQDQEDRTALREGVEEALRLSDMVSELKARYDAARNALGERDGELRESRLAIEADSKQVSELSLSERETSMEIGHLLEAVMEKHRVDVRRELNDYHDRELPDQSVRERVAELQRIVERMGEINLTAIEEYEERSERHTYLTAQREDLETALSQLEKAIRQMNRESRKLFREAFDEVNARFKEMFPRMFGGGKAELRLTDSEDMLESGIDIVAQPPGKKLTSIELMSGGEKALTAVSLIFSLFSYRPSPFCLLDEVDAPLDEANISRYCEMIRTMTDRSQFILITHSKTTMELGDVLYGVTMETPGVSKVVSVKMRDDEDRDGIDGAGNAASRHRINQASAAVA
ncbi:MAG: chromosome segregation protein SMC [Myxococcales bacterium]|nr:chromosome segregation protein SMC [Myxococcales bacterium]